VKLEAKTRVLDTLKSSKRKKMLKFRLSLDVFQVVLLKRHGIHNGFRRFSDANFDPFAFLGSLFAPFPGVPPGGPFGAILGSF